MRTGAIIVSISEGAVLQAIHQVKEQQDRAKRAKHAEVGSSFTQAEQHLRPGHVKEANVMPCEQPSDPLPSVPEPAQGRAPASGSLAAFSTAESASLGTASVTGQASAAAQPPAPGLYQQQQQPTQHDADHAGGASGSASAASDKQFPLYVLSKHGQELVCEVKATQWPRHLARFVVYTSISVYTVCMNKVHA